ELLEQAGLEVCGADAPRRRDERLDLPAPNEAATAELDALDLAGARPTPDRRGAEVDVRREEDPRRLLEADPVRCRWGHRQSSLVEAGLVLSEEDDAPASPPDAVDALESPLPEPPLEP